MPMTSRHRILAVAFAAPILALAACNSGTGAGSASPSTAQGASQSASGGASASTGAYTLTIAHTSAGDALAGKDGKTLYVFLKDSGGKSACNAGCTDTWPPFTLENGATAVAGAGVTGTIGSITRDDGAMQVTYAGRPLYYYAPDTQAGDAKGQGTGGVWFIANPSGAVPSASSSATASSSYGYH
jgi:predicted lipoprotein with Yx(FWY)xxD motif